MKDVSNGICRENIPKIRFLIGGYCMQWNIHGMKLSTISFKRFFRSNFDQSDTGRYSFIRFSVLVRIDEVPLSVIIDLLIGNSLSEGLSEEFK